MKKVKKSTKGSQAVKIKKELLAKRLRLTKGYEIVKSKTK